MTNELTATLPRSIVQTLGYRHESIPVAIDALASIAQNTSLYDPTFSEDPSLFTDEQLQPFKAVVFLSNSEEVLDLDGQAALTRWLGSGGSLIGLHAGSACLFNDTAFGTALGESNRRSCGLGRLACSFAWLSVRQASLTHYQLTGSWFDYHPDLQNVVRSWQRGGSIRIRCER